MRSSTIKDGKNSRIGFINSPNFSSESWFGKSHVSINHMRGSFK